MSRPVGPRDCALAIALPLSFEAFVADLRPSAPKDFAKGVARKVDLRPARLWASLVAPVADDVNRTADEAEAAGVRVCRAAGLADLTRLVRERAVVSLVTHCCFLPLRSADVVDAATVLARVQAAAAAGSSSATAPESPAPEPVDAFLARIPAVVAGRSADDLAGALLPLLSTTEQYFVDPVKWAAAAKVAAQAAGDDDGDAGYAAGLTRAILEEAYPNCFVPSRSVELADGLCSVDQLVDCLPNGFDGVLDLTMCNSLVPGEPIKRRRPQGTFLCNRRLADPHARLAIYRQTIDILADGPQPFEDAMAYVHLELVRYLNDRRNHERD